ncbi:xanthine dehydrogenase family protein molybdopterin-binding subunit [Alteribacillus sp. YIM 98480]|uniref:xanthine dehydrogenase family protein molybdopterin-binding subunit n=1 Tax=Alteribacillus sp. YIM 98480 TaxID=2606599 RepID=UPI00131CC2F3|nr:xanthine dehydrogenase family protein molybdopterin-binding subunit [Alteribacillus sp. YIM 98480]
MSITIADKDTENDLKIVGKNVKRSDALKKVTGTLDYVIDQKMPGMLHGKLLRSEYARAEIIKIDTTEAKAIKGVYDVLTGENLSQPVPRFGSIKEDQPLLADKEVKYHGEPIAIVLAVDEETAKKALKYVKVKYKQLPSVSTIEEALKPNAPIVHSNDQDNEKTNSNICGHWDYNWGDVDLQKENSSFTINNEFEFPMIHHFPIEPYSCISYPVDDELVIKTPIQHPFILRRVVAQALNMELSKVRAISNTIGGGFGGKGYPKIEPLAAYLAMETVRPVKITLSLDEGFFSARRSSAQVNICTGFNSEGFINYQDITIKYLIGAYADSAPRVAGKSSYLACGPYRTPNARINCEAVYSNTVPSTAFRGFGMPQLIWALESQMNEASKIVGLDPVDIRLKNLPEKGDVLIPGDNPVDGDWKQGLRKAAELIGWGKDNEKNKGKGIAIGIKNPIPASVSKSIVRLHADGSVTVSSGTSEMGQGAKTVMGQIAAEELGVPMNRVSVNLGDTSVAPFDTATAGSRSTVSMGRAIKSACDDIKNQIKEIIHELYTLKTSEEMIISDGYVKVHEKVISYAEILTEYMGPNLGEIVGRGVFKGTKINNHPMGGLADFWEIVFTASEVKVEKETGKLNINKLLNVSDVGCVINPLQAEAQEEGAAIMGLGHTLMEQLVYDNNSSKLMNGSALDYRVPTSMDIPDNFESDFIENHDGPGPFGAKGLGESGIIAVAPAVAGAVSEAVGIKMKDLPISAEKVWGLINNKK